MAIAGRIMKTGGLHVWKLSLGQEKPERLEDTDNEKMGGDEAKYNSTFELCHCMSGMLRHRAN
jgi:hypothetical protein